MNERTMFFTCGVVIGVGVAKFAQKQTWGGSLGMGVVFGSACWLIYPLILG